MKTKNNHKIHHYIMESKVKDILNSKVKFINTGTARDNIGYIRSILSEDVLLIENLKGFHVKISINSVWDIYEDED